MNFFFSAESKRVGGDDGTHYPRPQQGNPEKGMPADL